MVISITKISIRLWGRETGKTRPVLVIQNNIGNIYSPTTIVAVITDINLAKIKTIDKKRFTTPKLGALSVDTMKEVDNALKDSLALS